MRTTKCTFSRVISAMLVFLLALTASAPAFATPSTGEGIEITIRNNTGLPAMTSDQFIVYQLFTGTAHKETQPSPNPNVTTGNDWDPTNWNDYTLADIEWGSSVGAVDNQKNLIEALLALKTKTASWLGGENPFKDLKADDPASTAAEVAVLLEGKSNAFMQGFASWLLSESAKNTFTMTPVKDKDNNKDNNRDLTGTVNGNDSDPAEQYLTYIVPSAGYYLFAENLNTHGNHHLENDAVSEYIFAVLGEQDIKLKASVPTVDKSIVDSKTDTNKGDVAGVSDEVTFKLKGTLPKNFEDFDTYYYQFTDTLSKGLSLVWNKSVGETYIVTVEHDGTIYTISEDEYGALPTGSLKDPPGTDTTIIIFFSNLRKSDGLAYKESTGSSSSGKITLDGDDVIYVTYKASVNTDAVIGSSGNPNDVYLTYSNNPNSDSRGKTNEVRVYVYAFGLNLKKVGSDDAHNGLAGAGFVLKNSSGNYAIFKDQWVNGERNDFSDTENAGHNTMVRRLIGWTNTTGSTTTENILTTQQVENLIKKCKDDKTTGEKDLKDYLLKSGDDGKIPDVYGLDEGTYTLQEVITPDGYNTMDDFEFSIKAEIDANGILQSVTYTSTDPEKNVTYDRNNLNDQPIFESGLLSDTLTNQKAPFLPFTGGIGTVIFYVIGAMLIAGAVIYLVILTQKRKKAKKNA